MVEGIALGTELAAENRLLPDKLGEELWRAAGAALVEVSRAEFAEALETIGARDNYGLDPERQADEQQRESLWRGLHLEELAIARLVDADASVRRVAKDAGLELSAHVLRHTCLTNLVRQGEDLVMVAEIAGHAKIETTRRYSLPSAADKQAAIDAIAVDY